ncbi:hypothetical protein [Streptomyces sp. NPDC053367]|uniref:hypothetical protein n=1 Tax=Streptomyces sp. NPDC053367 TaxID=3365700 RepID=UPI0037CE15FD
MDLHSGNLRALVEARRHPDGFDRLKEIAGSERWVSAGGGRARRVLARIRVVKGGSLADITVGDALEYDAELRKTACGVSSGEALYYARLRELGHLPADAPTALRFLEKVTGQLTCTQLIDRHPIASPGIRALLGRVLYGAVPRSLPAQLALLLQASRIRSQVRCRHQGVRWGGAVVAKLIRDQELDVEVDFYGFALQDVDDTQVPLEYPEGRVSEGPFLTAREGRLDIESAGHTHTATMTAEIWDGPPPVAEDRGDWEERGEAELHCVSGELAVWGVAGGPMDTYLHLSDGEGMWRVRVYCEGRAEVRRLATEGVPEGIEHYLVQFWPAHA